MIDSVYLLDTLSHSDRFSLLPNDPQDDRYGNPLMSALKTTSKEQGGIT